MQVLSLGQEDPLEEGTATHSSILAWRIPWTEEPGGLQSTGLQRVEHHSSSLANTWLIHVVVHQKLTQHCPGDYVCSPNTPRQPGG